MREIDLPKGLGSTGELVSWLGLEIENELDGKGIQKYTAQCGLI